MIFIIFFYFPNRISIKAKKEENGSPHVTKMELFQSFLPSFFLPYLSFLHIHRIPAPTKSILGKLFPLP